jgi:hypothetical protein
MRRCRIVHADVTSEYLEQIDCDRCVVTLESMSHSARAETDWSVDRINNDGAYAAGNLMVISTRANRAKGAKTYAEVVNFGAGDCYVDRERLELCPMGAPRLRDGWLRRNSRHACDSYAASHAHSGG